MIFQRKTAEGDSGALGRGMLLLEKVDKTSGEKAAAGAFRRMMTGALLLTAGMVVSLCAVMVRFDPVPGSGTTQNWYEQYAQARIGIITEVAMLWITLLFLYAAACRLTPFAKAWFLYCRAQRKEADESLQKGEARSGIAAYVFLVVMALLTCWPQVASLQEHLAVMRSIEAFEEISQEEYQPESQPLE